MSREWIGSGDPAIERTVAAMRDVLDGAVLDLRIREVAESVTKGCASYDDRCVVYALYRFVRGRVRYRLDPRSVELVKAPSRLLTEIDTQGVAAGDCDDQTLLLAALLRALGFATRFVLISQRADGDLHHIYLEVLVGNRWLALDPIAPGGEWGGGIGGTPYATRRVYA